uniref:Secreted protein n=1 Tax=Trichogramma kaykai TaxID=54128 RepID=A0ABD2X3Q3_9HYME
MPIIQTFVFLYYSRQAVRLCFFSLASKRQSSDESRIILSILKLANQYPCEVRILFSTSSWNRREIFSRS